MFSDESWRKAGNFDTVLFRYMFHDWNMAGRELGSYKRMDDGRLNKKLPISRLHGRVLGLLLTYADCRDRTLDSATKGTYSCLLAAEVGTLGKTYS